MTPELNPEALPAFTKGPWIAERRRNCSVVLQTKGKCDGYSNRVAECPQWAPTAHPKPTPDEAFANARLIAAAPDLYEALTEWLTVGNDMKARRAVREKARAALRKADGS